MLYERNIWAMMTNFQKICPRAPWLSLKLWIQWTHTQISSGGPIFFGLGKNCKKRFFRDHRRHGIGFKFLKFGPRQVKIGALWAVANSLIINSMGAFSLHSFLESGARWLFGSPQWSGPSPRGAPAASRWSLLISTASIPSPLFRPPLGRTWTWRLGRFLVLWGLLVCVWTLHARRVQRSKLAIFFDVVLLIGCQCRSGN